MSISRSLTGCNCRCWAGFFFSGSTESSLLMNSKRWNRLRGKIRDTQRRLLIANDAFFSLSLSSSRLDDYRQNFWCDHFDYICRLRNCSSTRFREDWELDENMMRRWKKNCPKSRLLTPTRDLYTYFCVFFIITITIGHFARVSCFFIRHYSIQILIPAEFVHTWDSNSLRACVVWVLSRRSSISLLPLAHLSFEREMWKALKIRKLLFSGDALSNWISHFFVCVSPRLYEVFFNNNLLNLIFFQLQTHCCCSVSVLCSMKFFFFCVLYLHPYIQFPPFFELELDLHNRDREEVKKTDQKSLSFVLSSAAHTETSLARLFMQIHLLNYSFPEKFIFSFFGCVHPNAQKGLINRKGAARRTAKNWWEELQTLFTHMHTCIWDSHMKKHH